MNKNISLTLCTLFFLSIWEPVFGLDIQPVYAKCNQYTLSCRIDGDSLLITGNPHYCNTRKYKLLFS